MPKQRRSKKDLTMTVVGVGAGFLAGKIAVPKLVDMVDKDGKVDPKIIKGAAAVGSFLLARGQKGFPQNALIGLAAGLATDVVMDVAGIGYIVDYSTDLNHVAGDGEMNYGPSRQNPGAV